MGVSLAPGPVKTGSDPPQQAPGDAVSPGGRGWSRGQRMRSFSPQTAVYNHTQEETTSLQMQTREAEGHCAGSVCVLPVFPARRGSGAAGSPPQTLARLQQLLLGSFTFL